jgi:hypothetical protein
MEQQIIGRLSALEAIVCQLLTLRLVNDPDKDKILAVMKDGFSSQTGTLSEASKPYAIGCAKRVFDTSRATALHLEGR